MNYINADVTRIDSEAKYPLGAKHNPVDGNEEFRYVKYNQGSNSVSATAGYLAYMIGAGTSTPEFAEVTCDYNSATTYVTLTAVPAGFFQSALTDGKYGWVQTKGRNKVAMLTDGSVTQNSEIVADPTANGRVKVAGGVITVGTALAADSSTSQAIGTAICNVKTW
jgi:hypothetical protein